MQASERVMIAALLATQLGPLETVSLNVGDLERMALVSRASGKGPAPLVFCVHGHGGTARSAMRSFGFEKLWPEAVVCYPQGVPTVTPNDPQGSRNGWQMRPLPSPNKDLVYFDALLASIKANRKIDPKRIYVMGHSNGGGFTYLLAAQRNEVFAAFAPSASSGVRFVEAMKPKPVFHVTGTQDPIVKFADQVEVHRAVLKKLGLESVKPKVTLGTPSPLVGRGQGEGKSPVLSTYQNEHGMEFSTYIYPGTHKYPAEANALIVEFFKRHSL